MISRTNGVLARAAALVLALAAAPCLADSSDLARKFHPLPAAHADASALRGRAPSSRFDVPSSTPSPRDHAGRRLDALATKVGEIRGLVALLAGEYDNNEQVWQQEIDGVAPYPRRHWRFRARGESALELAVGPGQAAPDTVGWTIAFDDDPQDLVTEFVGASQCRYRWRAQDAGYEGHVADGDCAGLPARFAVDVDWLTSTWSAPHGDRVERARRVRYYTGWVALRRSRVDPDAAPDDYIFVRGVRWHDEGFVLAVLDGDRSTGYALDLARLTYQNTGTAVLKLGVVDTASGETLSYAWAEPGARRIGINLRWIQAGLTLVP